MTEIVNTRQVQFNTGDVFDYLTYQGVVVNSASRYRLGAFLCKCGTAVIAALSEVKHGKRTSCGCKRREARTQPGFSKGEDHFKSSYWEIKSPNGVTIEGTNLCEIIRKNEHMFDPSDVQWRKRANSNQERCRARDGIYRLLVTKADGEYRNQSWKGWKLVNHNANEVRLRQKNKEE